MAVVGGRVAIAATNDGIAVVKKELIVDPESGLLLEAENIKVAVDVGGGNIVVREQQRITGIHVPGAGSSASRRAIEPPRARAPPPQRSSSRSRSSCVLQ